MIKQTVKRRICWLTLAFLIIGVVWVGVSQMQVLSGGDPYDIDAATIDGDMLLVTVSYGGGCKKHEFTLDIDGGFLESNPVQARVRLLHDANGDLCAAYITEERQFDLTPFKTLYQQGYRQQEGVIIIRLEGAPEGGLVYEF